MVCIFRCHGGRKQLKLEECFPTTPFSRKPEAEEPKRSSFRDTTAAGSGEARRAQGKALALCPSPPPARVMAAPAPSSPQASRLSSGVPPAPPAVPQAAARRRTADTGAREAGKALQRKKATPCLSGAPEQVLGPGSPGPSLPPGRQPVPAGSAAGDGEGPGRLHRTDTPRGGPAHVPSPKKGNAQGARPDAGRH